MARLIGVHGEDMLRRGDAASVARLVEQVIGESLDDESELLHRTYADALRMSGDPTRARRAFAHLVARADEAGWTPGLAARVAQLHYMCGEFESAIDVLDRCTDLPDPEAADREAEEIVDWWSCRVHVLAMLGRPGEAEAAAARCLDAAERLGDARPLAVAHIAVGQDLPGHAEGPAPRARPPVRGPGRRRHDGDSRTRGAHPPAAWPPRATTRRASPPARRPGWPACPALPGSRRRSCTTWARHSPVPGSSRRRCGTSRPRSRCAAGWGLPGPPWAWSGRAMSTGRSGTRSRAVPPIPRRRSWPAGPATCRCSCPRCRVRPCSQPTSRRTRPSTRQPRHCGSPRTTCCRSP